MPHLQLFILQTMTKVRIGNDISLSVDLRQYLIDRSLKELDVYSGKSREIYGLSETDEEGHTIYDKDFQSFRDIDRNGFVNKCYEVYYPHPCKGCCCGDNSTCKGEGLPVSIQSVKAILVNTTKREEVKQYRAEHEDAMRNYYNALRKHSRFIARFPIEPAMECFAPTPHDICVSGYPTWRAYPHSRHMRVLGPHYYAMAPYHGFGVRPHWEGIYKPLYPMPPLPPKVDKSKLSDKNTIYYAQVAATNKQNVVEVLFPARDQHLNNIGEYKLILVVKVYVPGYNSQNTKTITIDVPNVFALVDSTAEASEVIEDLNGKPITVQNGVGVTVKSIVDNLAQGSWDRGYDNVQDYDPMDPGYDKPNANDIYINSAIFGDEDGIINLGRTDDQMVELDLRRMVGWADPDIDY